MLWYELEKKKEKSFGFAFGFFWGGLFVVFDDKMYKRESTGFFEMSLIQSDFLRKRTKVKIGH